jgi:hypothetical protein
MEILFSPKNKNMPVKATMVPDPKQQPAMNVVVLYKNYDFKKPAKDIFAIPAGYTKAANDQEAMGGGAGALGALMRAAAAAAEQEDEDDDDGKDAKKDDKEADVQDAVKALRRLIK